MKRIWGLVFLLVCFNLLVFIPEVSAKNSKKLHVKANRALNFGQVYAGAANIRIPEDSGDALEVEISGGKGEKYQVAFAEEKITLRPKKGRGELLVGEFTTTLANNTGTLDNRGKDHFYVGATLQEVPPTADGEDYEGEITITVEYTH